MADRYYVPGPLDSNATWIEGPVAHHMVNVMRLKPGDAVVLFDGSGIEYHAAVCEVEKRRLRVEITSAEQVDRESTNTVHIWSALPKGDRQRFLIEKLVETGARSFRPLVTRRSVVKPNERQQAKYEKWVVEATQQCGRSHLMAIEPAMDFREAIAERYLGWRLLGDPRGQPLKEVWRLNVDSAGPTATDIEKPSAVVMIGPEGGWADDELQMARDSGWLSASWGNTIMRIETAAIVATVLLNSET